MNIVTYRSDPIVSILSIDVDSSGYSSSSLDADVLDTDTAMFS